MNMNNVNVEVIDGVQNNSEVLPVVPVEENAQAALATEDYQNVLNSLSLEVNGEGEDGRIVVSSKRSKKRTTIRSIARLSQEQLIQICGPVAKTVVGDITLATVKEALAEAAYGASRLSSDKVRRQGIWGTPDGSIAVVGKNTLCKWDGRTLRSLDSSFDDDMFYDTAQAVWKVDFAQLKQDLEQFDGKKCADIFRRLCTYQEQWIWVPGDRERNARVACFVAGLYVATFVQTLWNWRPQVSLLGESHSGKTWNLDLGGRIFGDLAKVTAKATFAGICQSLQSSATACFIDEFEQDRHRIAILDAIRTSGGGASIFRGTTDMKGVSFQLQHLIWIAATEDGISRAADVNRFIRLHLHKPTAGTARLKLPNKAESAEMHQYLTVMAIRFVSEAKALVENLVENVHVNIDTRIVENYAVPVAMSSLILGEESEAAARLREALELIPVERKSSDQADLLATILGSHLPVPGEGTLFVSQALRHVLDGASNRSACHEALELHGIRVLAKDQGRFVMFGSQPVERFLLKGTPWKGKNIATILRRIPGAEKEHQRLAKGPAVRGTAIPVSELDIFPESEPVVERRNLAGRFRFHVFRFRHHGLRRRRLHGPAAQRI